PTLVTIDTPSNEFCVSQPVKTNTPSQALVLMNVPVYVEAAAALARRMADHSTRPAEQLHYGYRLALVRDPDSKALEVLTRLYQDSLQHYREQAARPILLETSFDGGLTPAKSPELAALTIVANTIMNLDEFVNRE